MPARIRRPSAAEVLASIALFASLGGGAYAATSLPKNSVGAKQLRKSAVERSKIKASAVDGSRVADDALTGADVDESTLTGVSAARLDRVSYKTGSGSVAPQSLGVVTARCDAGQVATGGGVRVDDPENAYVIDEYPDSGNTAFTARVGNGSDSPVGMTVFAICLPGAAG